jgi:hypothetical protein
VHDALLAGKTAAEIEAICRPGMADFQRRRTRYLLYEPSPQHSAKPSTPTCHPLRWTARLWRVNLRVIQACICLRPSATATHPTSTR